MRKLGNRNVPIFTINTIGQSIIRPPKFRIEDIVRQGAKIIPKASVDSFFFLERDSKEEIVPIAKDEALTKAIENSDDAFLFPLLEKIDTKIVRSESRCWYKAVLDCSLLKVGLT
jgi:hypothetical protein